MVKQESVVCVCVISFCVCPVPLGGRKPDARPSAQQLQWRKWGMDGWMDEAFPHPQPPALILSSHPLPHTAAASL